MHKAIPTNGAPEILWRKRASCTAIQRGGQTGKWPEFHYLGSRSRSAVL